MLVVGRDVYALAVLGILTLVWFLVPLGVCLRGVFRSAQPRARARGTRPDAGGPVALAEGSSTG